MKYLNQKLVMERLSISRSTLWRWTSENNFPKPLKLSPGCTRWRLIDIEQWEEAREQNQKSYK